MKNACVSSRGDQYAIANHERVFVISIQTGAEIQRIELGARKHLTKISYSTTGKFLVITTYHGATFYDAKLGEEVFVSVERGNPLVSFSNDDSRVLIASRSGGVKARVMDTAAWKTVVSRDGSKQNRSGAVLSGDGQTVLLGLSDCRVEMWGLKKMKR